ncbi:class I SAM-dependent methyltransferase [Paenibacillus barengoltzii]|jgi:ubiquinone/menaquinone biosynthesis C-methylase UbiE|uniref:Ubiquinone/menaquinone biosynthesis C-methylase UbiE n=1 Tax=Paenibacillus barengoltzii J12 TaxID=935846 RepID=A0ABY1LUQ9_9BACL|nr:class I SAM-dependent methyltransferase [Paenibacillus barengoltzii]SMF08248.1 Ubiquinone/menaquinone biosynthesis C-methylase UbiE [Paenibacillus barengoltzii J12]
MSEQIRQNNIERFTGFSDLYDQNRPKAPVDLIDILTMYLERRPEVVADVGCGTGLSSFIWLERANQIVGIEPNDDMRAVAINRWKEVGKPQQLEFVKGLSYELPLEASSVDLVTCSQSFHWMDPQPTLQEFARVLRPGGIFAAYDCDWPPVVLPELEQAYVELTKLADQRVSELSETGKEAYKWPKDQHLQQIRKSGLFRYSREIVFHHWEDCDADRYANLALSQGGVQTALKLGADEILTAAEHFRKRVKQGFGGKRRRILFGYRMRLGVK